MKRREFITLFGGAAAAWPLAARAQQPAGIPRIGVLRTTGPGTQPAVEELRQGLRELGYTEPRTMAIEFRSAEGRVERMPGLAADLVRRKVAVIVAYGPQAIQAAKDATTMIPIVMGRMDDADAHGFVTNYARPAGNITGLSFPSGELSTKLLELLKEILPPGARMAALWDEGGTSHQVRLIEKAARSVGIDLDVLGARSAQGLPAAFAAARQGKAKGLVVLPSPVWTSEIVALAKLALEHRVAAIYIYRGFTAAGGLLSYGPKDNDPSFSFRRAAYFVDRILRGAQPGDLPVEQPTRFYLTVNQKSAKAIGLEIAPMLLARADEVIE